MVLRKFNTNKTPVSITRLGKMFNFIQIPLYGLPHSRWSFAMTPKSTPSVIARKMRKPVFPKSKRSVCDWNTTMATSDVSARGAKHPQEPEAKQSKKNPCHPELVSGSYGDSLKMLKQVQHDKKEAAFSLVELLMALLVASLLMAALAPVMTRKFKENISVSSVGSGVKSDYSRTFYDDFEWAVPAGVNRINVTSIGGGGGGGGATYGYKKIMSTENNWTVPDGVTKLRIFMTGAGGGGASGGLDVQYAKTQGRDDGKIYEDFLTPGETSFTVKNRIVPALNNKCTESGTTKWLTDLAQSEIQSRDNVLTEYAPNASIQTKVTACGGGGGGSGGGWDWSQINGGSGGYVINIPVSFTESNIYVKIGGAGGESVKTGGYGAGGGGGNRGKDGNVDYASTGAGGGQFGGNGGNASATLAVAGANGETSGGILLSSGGARGYTGTNTYYGGAGGRGGIWGGGGGGGGVST